MNNLIFQVSGRGKCTQARNNIPYRALSLSLAVSRIETFHLEYIAIGKCSPLIIVYNYHLLNRQLKLTCFSLSLLSRDASGNIRGAINHY